MGYKVTCNLEVAKGVEFKTGDSYTGPVELIDSLLKDGCIVMDAAIKDEPKAAAPEVDSESDDIFDEPEKKASKKSGKKGK